MRRRAVAPREMTTMHEKERVSSTNNWRKGVARLNGANVNCWLESYVKLAA